jgi:GMP synthase-like glutamine amidotransferase
MHVLAFRHAPLEGIGTIAAALDRHHIACVTVDTTTSHQPLATSHGLVGRRHAPPEGLGRAPSGLILMGGPMSANDDLPWVPHELAAIREAVHRGIPVLGVCLGAQLIARVLGARVYPNTEKEIGWSPLHFTEAAAADPLFHGFSGPETVFQWHAETFDLPPGAEHLAYSSACRHQAFRVGGNVYGMQFHLEVTPEMVADWLRQDAACGDLREATARIDPHAHASRLAEVAATVFDRWCGLLH